MTPGDLSCLYMPDPGAWICLACCKTLARVFIALGHAVGHMLLAFHHRSPLCSDVQPVPTHPAPLQSLPIDPQPVTQPFTHPTPQPIPQQPSSEPRNSLCNTHTLNSLFPSTKVPLLPCPAPAFHFNQKRGAFCVLGWEVDPH